jgi:acyl carrier protein
MTKLLSELQEVFRAVFDDDSLVISDSSSATDINGWDSMAHMNLIIATEKQFDIKFTAAEIAALGRRGQTVGDIVRLLEIKTTRESG